MSIFDISTCQTCLLYFGLIYISLILHNKNWWSVIYMTDIRIQKYHKKHNNFVIHICWAYGVIFRIKVKTESIKSHPAFWLLHTGLGLSAYGLLAPLRMLNLLRLLGIGLFLPSFVGTFALIADPVSWSFVNCSLSQSLSLLNVLLRRTLTIS